MWTSLILLLGCCMVVAGQGLSCPKLAPEIICGMAEPGFEYSDGCNRVECTEGGQFTSTLIYCDGPRNREQHEMCAAQQTNVYYRLGPFSCPNLEASRICSRREAGFEYSDGCNGVTCEADGGFTTTMMACPAADPNGPYCEFMESRLRQAGRGRPQRRRRR